MRLMLIVLIIIFSQAAYDWTLDEEVDILFDTTVQLREYNYYASHEGVNWSYYDRLMDGIDVRKEFLDQRKSAGETRYMIINRSQYRLRVIDDGKVVVEEKVIVGRQSRQTCCKHQEKTNNDGQT